MLGLNSIPAWWALPKKMFVWNHVNNVPVSNNQVPTVMATEPFTRMVTLLPTATGFCDASRVNAKRPRRGRRVSFEHIKQENFHMKQENIQLSLYSDGNESTNLHVAFAYSLLVSIIVVFIFLACRSKNDT